MKKIYLNSLSSAERDQLTKRPAIDFTSVFGTVKEILSDIKIGGLEAALKYARQFDGLENDEIMVPVEEIRTASGRLDGSIKAAIELAINNVKAYHLKQMPASYELETVPGVLCRREFRAIEDVALYIPGGSAVLPSTMIMLGVPAVIAGCRRIAVCTPAKNGRVNDAVLYAASQLGISEIYKLGGAQAIGLLGYGSKEVKRVSKIFGPGNQYVTAAKMLLSIDPGGCAIDMPAGPSEVLIISDGSVKAAYTAADMLSQAEHGKDSQAILISTSESFADEVIAEIRRQLEYLSRKELIMSSLENSFILISEGLEEAISFSNDYAPEHLILQTDEPMQLKDKIQNAGSVFMGGYSPESAGDYASGTNHSLPTYGYAKAFSGVSVDSFMKSISIQSLSQEGLKALAPAIEALCDVEGLDAHKNAIKIRIEYGYK